MLKYGTKNLFNLQQRLNRTKEWDRIFENGPNNICGKIEVVWVALRLPSTDFTWCHESVVSNMTRPKSPVCDVMRDNC